MSKPTKPVLSLVAAIALAQTFVSANADIIGEQTHDVEGGSLVLRSFSNHIALAESYYNLCDLDGKIKSATSKRNDVLKTKVSQFRIATLLLDSGETIEKIGETFTNDKGETIAREIPLHAALLVNTDPLSFLTLPTFAHLSINYQVKPKPLALPELIASHPKLADFAAIEGLTLKPASKESIIVSFASEEAFDAYWLAVSNILPENRLKSAGEMVSFKMAGVDMPFSPLARQAFKMSFSGRFETVESQAILLLVA